MTFGGEGADKGKNCYSKEYITTYGKTYCDTHREKVNENHRKIHKRRMEQPEYVKMRRGYAKKYYEEHKEQCIERDKKYYEEHKEEIKAKARERYWKKKNSIKPSE